VTSKKINISKIADDLRGKVADVKYF